MGNKRFITGYAGTVEFNVLSRMECCFETGMLVFYYQMFFTAEGATGYLRI
jgi:hypothetical protein